MIRIKYNLPVKKESNGNTLFPNSLMRGKYSGLSSTAKSINEYIPSSKIYVEPFAGLGRTVENRHDKIILNDMSDYAVDYLKINFPYAEITQEDFMVCIKNHDSENTFFLIDPPWRTGHYKYNDLPYCDRNAYDYYVQLMLLFPRLKGTWILCCDKKEMEIKKICSKSGYHNKIIESNQMLFGRRIGVMLTSNKPFVVEKENPEK